MQLNFIVIKTRTRKNKQLNKLFLFTSTHTEINNRQILKASIHSKYKQSKLHADEHTIDSHTPHTHTQYTYLWGGTVPLDGWGRGKWLDIKNTIDEQIKTHTKLEAIQSEYARKNWDNSIIVCIIFQNEWKFEIHSPVCLACYRHRGAHADKKNQPQTRNIHIQ